MTDEIELLRAYRAEVPGPSEAAWERARAAIAAASNTDVPSTAKRRRRRLALYSALGAVATAVTGVLLVVLLGTPHLTEALHTAWQPARALPAAEAADDAQQHTPAGTWRLTSFLSTEGWQLNTSGPEAGPLTCPTITACYLEGDNSASASGPADMDTFYISADGGRSWSALPVPDGVTFSSPLTCTSAVRCAAGGLYRESQPVFLTTGDGGHSWTITPLPSGVGQIVQLDCPTALYCRGLEWNTGQQLAANFPLQTDMRFIATNDGGGHFTVTAFPRGESIESLSCPTATRCAAVGVYDASGPVYDHGRTWDFGSPEMQGIVLTTRNGGVSWQPGAFPRDAGTGPFPEITCPDAADCWLIDAVGSGAAGSSANRSQVAVSSDGGATWTAQQLPPGQTFPEFLALTCPTAATCYAPSDVPKTIPGRITAALYVTHDAGRTWSLVTFAQPSKVPAGMASDSFMAIGSIQCPAPNACIALGVTDQGQKITPVYTTGSS